MLKRLIILLVVLGFVLSAAIYLTGYLTFKMPEVIEESKITMSMLTDAETYHSGEYMEIRVSTASNKDLDSAILRVYGIKDRFEKYTVNEEEIVQIDSPGNETVFLVSMPRCYGCAGVSPGEYEIKAELIYEGEIIGNTTKTINLVK